MPIMNNWGGQLEWGWKLASVPCPPPAALGLSPLFPPCPSPAGVLIRAPLPLACPTAAAGSSGVEAWPQSATRGAGVEGAPCPAAMCWAMCTPVPAPHTPHATPLRAPELQLVGDPCAGGGGTATGCCAGSGHGGHAPSRGHVLHTPLPARHPAATCHVPLPCLPCHAPTQPCAMLSCRAENHAPLLLPPFPTVWWSTPWPPLSVCLSVSCICTGPRSLQTDTAESATIFIILELMRCFFPPNQNRKNSLPFYIHIHGNCVKYIAYL